MIANSYNLERPEWTILRNRVMQARATNRDALQSSQSEDGDRLDARTCVWSGVMDCNDLHVPVAPEFSIRQLMLADDFRRFQRFVQVAARRKFVSCPPVRAGGMVFTVRIEPRDDGAVDTYWIAN